MKLVDVLTALFVFLVTQTGTAQQPNAKFARDQVLADMDYLYHSLIDAHYDIYAYVDEKNFFENYQGVKRSVDMDSLTRLEATNLFQKVISAANNGHTEIDFPGASYIEYAQNGGTLFPLEIAFENQKGLVRKNFSNDSTITLGAEIISINGRALTEILDEIYRQVSAERDYFKRAKIEMYSFPRYYWQVFGAQEEFEVQLRVDGTTTTHRFASVPAIEGFEMKREEVLNAQMTLKFHEHAAYLNPGDFSGDEEKYRQFIDSAFVTIQRKGVGNLIIDLRNNRGGNDSFSDYLVAYIADKPFKWTSNFTLKTSRFLKAHTRQHNDTTQTYFKEILAHQNGETYAPKLDFYPPQPPSKRFHGAVYVLVNRQTHSQSAVTAAQLQDYGFGTIVGEETGEFPSLYASQFQYSLPKTGIPVKVSKGRILRINGSTKEEGVVPDILINDHLLDETDEILDALLDRLKP